jgi:hypothetical protein
VLKRGQQRSAAAVEGFQGWEGWGWRRSAVKAAALLLPKSMPTKVEKQQWV